MNLITIENKNILLHLFFQVIKSYMYVDYNI